MKVWDHGSPDADDTIDDFTFLRSEPLSMFDQSNPSTTQGIYGIGNLTLIYGNLTTDSTSCNSAVQTTFIINTYTAEGTCSCIRYR